MFKNLNREIEQIGRDKGIDKKILIEALEAALLTAARKKYGAYRDIEAHYNEEKGEIELFEFKTVVEKVEDDEIEISLEDARKLDPEAQVGDSLGIRMDSSEFGRIAAQTAKQVIIQKVRDAEREIIYNEYIDRKGEIISGIVRRFERGDIIVDLGRTEAVLPKDEQIPREHYRPNDRVQAYVVDVQKTARGPQIVLSRTHPNFLLKLFESQVPEIAEGIVEIVSVAREPGVRAKIAVRSKDPDVDPVGACVGMKGARVQNIVQELRGERIDIVPWDENPIMFVKNAIHKAEVSRIICRNSQKSMEVIVPDDQLSLAIGRKGQNVRLAAQLTGWKIDIFSESRIKEQAEQIKKLFRSIDGIGENLSEIFYNHGLRSLDDILGSTDKEIMELSGLDEERVRAIREQALEMKEKLIESDIKAKLEAEKAAAEIEEQEETAAAGKESEGGEENSDADVSGGDVSSESTGGKNTGEEAST